MVTNEHAYPVVYKAAPLPFIHDDMRWVCAFSAQSRRFFKTQEEAEAEKTRRLSEIGKANQ